METFSLELYFLHLRSLRKLIAVVLNIIHLIFIAIIFKDTPLFLCPLKKMRYSNRAADLSQKPGCEEAKQYSIVGFTVKPRHTDGKKLPQLALPAVQRPGGESHINQDYIGTALNEPTAKVDLWEKNKDKVWRGNISTNVPPTNQGKRCLFLHWKFWP